MTDSPPAAPFDTAARYRLDPNVAVRPEPLGGLAYHYGTRRLTFLRSRLLAELVRDLDQHESVDAAIESVVPSGEQASYRKALASLAESRFICAC